MDRPHEHIQATFWEECLSGARAFGNVPRRSCWPLTREVEVVSIGTCRQPTIIVMSHSRSPWPEEEESWWDALGAVFEPLSEVALYLAICIIGGEV
jgi:hypothetical protein